MNIEEAELINDLMFKIESMAGYYMKGSELEISIQKLKDRLSEIKAKNLLHADVSGNEVAVAFADWIGQKTQQNSWFKFDWQGWYIHLKGHMTSFELFKVFEKAKATDHKNLNQHK